MRSDLLLVSADGWRWLGSDGRARWVEPFPNIESPTRVLVAFETAYTGVTRFEGKSQYAAAFIEREVRQQGWLEGVGHVVLHRLERSHGGGLAFYTAVRLDAWQQMQNWAAHQSDHCLVYPANALLGGVAEGACRVMRVGRHLRFLACSSEGLFTQDAVGASADADDMVIAAETLGGDLIRQVNTDLLASVEWIATATDSPDGEQRMARAMAERAGVATSHADLSSYTDGEQETLSAVPGCLRQLGAKAAVNSPTDKLAWWQEAAAGPVGAVVMALALGLGGVGEYWRQVASDERAQANERLTEVRELRAQFQDTDLADDREALRAADAFISPMVERAPFAPARLLDDVHSALSPGLRIHRVLLQGGDEHDAEGEGNGSYHVIVDGRNLRGQRDAMRQFLKNLRAQGWQTTPLKPASDAPGSFSYRLSLLGVGS